MTPAEMSKLLFCAREEMSMWADVVEIRTGERPEHTLGLISQIDAYRAEQGWSPDGFGGES
jgi:hypothetical protein